MKSSGIGGQAVIEGVMMKNKDQYAIAVRKPDHEIIVEQREYKSLLKRNRFFRLPIIRGVVTFIESMAVGMKTLTYSASFYDEEEAKASKIEQAANKVLKDKAESVFMGLSILTAIIAAIGIFMILPWFLADLLGGYIQNPILQALVEGALRLVIFILYVLGISMMQDIKRVYMYHGAEHKAINCIESGCDLTVENVRKQSRQHKRCGTSFLLYVMVISILFFMVIRVDDSVLRVVYRILLVPVIAGVSYEFIRLAGSSNFFLIKLLSAPGLWLQKLTTREPDDDMIEVAICSVEAVFDWKAYLSKDSREVKKSKQSRSKSRNVDAVRKKEQKESRFIEDVAEKSSMEESAVTIEKAEKKSVEKNENLPKKAVALKANRSNREDFKPSINRKNARTVSSAVAAKKAQAIRTPLPVIEEMRNNYPIIEEEDDEVLSALDKFFMGDKK